jgi:DNA-directed RNA polymerase specialized sigma24 family protein
MTVVEEWGRAVYEGRATFDAFVVRTRATWERLAEMIARRWALPAWVTHDDVVQDLLLGAWEAMWRWDAARTRSIERFLVWCAVDKAKKRAHKARGAERHRGADGNPGRYERPLSAFDDENDPLTTLATAPEQDALISWDAMVDRARVYCRSAAEVRAVQALAAEYSVRAAALRLYTDPRMRVECRLASPGHAERWVSQVVRALSARARTEGWSS